MVDQVLKEMDNNAENYAIFAKRWTNELRPLLQFQKYLETRDKDIKAEELREEANADKEISNGSGKNPAKNKKKTS